MIRSLLRNAGVWPRRWLAVLAWWRRYAADRQRFRSMPGADALPWGKELPMLGEWLEASGQLGAYFFQDQMVARWVLEDAPARHVDVGSRVDGFVGNLAVCREVEVIDLRPLPQTIRNVRFHQLDLMAELPESWRAVADSVSCLHSLEHFGLGRYGDSLDPLGHLKGLAQLKAMVKPGGRLYLSVPIGVEQVVFNAHRVFAAETLMGWFDDGWTIERCGLIDEENHVREEGEEVLREFRGEVGIGAVAAVRSAVGPTGLGRP